MSVDVDDLVHGRRRAPRPYGRATWPLTVGWAPLLAILGAALALYLGAR